MGYSWKERSLGHFRKLDAEKCGRELERIAKAGNLTPEKLVQHARSPRSAFHSGFTWDDTAAAEAYRRSEAGKLLGAIVIVEEETEREMRAFVNVIDGEGEDSRSLFVSIGAAMSSPIYREHVLKTALAELESFRKKYAHLEELAHVLTAAAEVLEQHQAVSV